MIVSSLLLRIPDGGPSRGLVPSISLFMPLILAVSTLRLEGYWRYWPFLGPSCRGKHRSFAVDREVTRSTTLGTSKIECIVSILLVWHTMAHTHTHNTSTPTHTHNIPGATAAGVGEGSLISSPTALIRRSVTSVAFSKAVTGSSSPISNLTPPPKLAVTHLTTTAAPTLTLFSSLTSPQHIHTATMLRTPITRAVGAAARSSAVIARPVQSRAVHAISNPTLANIEKRWEQMPPQEQADVWMALRDRMKTNWAELTLQEKKAAYWIAFGAHGPRAVAPPGEGWKVLGYTLAGIAVSFGLFATVRAFARGPPATMTKEYQEASNEYLLAQNSDPISGLSSEGYKGPGMVQSPPAAKK
ncbi:hypothetical protein V490_03334 [Pseudogymnoascus sp. VKM F-3557]|nr:hypothetical protein V490_03334 [Pseudogymnoascus sp. VKM F-3557]